jgi:hypothetical protein
MYKVNYTIEYSDKIKLLENPRTTLNNYKKISMYLPLGITCIWKCVECCNIYYKNNTQYLEASIDNIIEEYETNILVEAIVISGLEPFDNFGQLYNFISKFREFYEDDIVIFSGYEKKEVEDMLEHFYIFDNIIYKFGRYIPDRPSKYDEILGITLASDNQYGFKIT